MNATIVALILAMLAAPPTQAQPPRDQRSAAPTGTAMIRGRVVDAQSGRPIGLATLTAFAPELGSENRSISTNSEGRYELRNLPPGRYNLSVSRAGYLTLRYGQRRPLEQGSVLQLLDQQIADHVDFALPRMSVISGRITDEEGEPVAGALVAAMQMVFFDGGRRPVFAGVGAGNSTDEAGQFRIGGLVPGDYFVRGTSGKRGPAPRRVSSGCSDTRRRTFRGPPTAARGASRSVSAPKPRIPTSHSCRAVPRTSPARWSTRVDGLSPTGA